MSGAVPSSSEMMRQILFTKMNRNESDESFDKALLIQVSKDTAVDIQSASGRAAQTLVGTLDGLKTLGYDKDSDVYKNQVKVNDKINDVLVKLAEAAARHAG